MMAPSNCSSPRRRPEACAASKQPATDQLRRTFFYSCCLALIGGVNGWPGSNAAPVTTQTQHPVSTRLGTHLLLEVTDAPFERLNSSSMVLSALHASVNAARLTVVGELSHQFPVMGFSAVIMIRYSCACAPPPLHSCSFLRSRDFMFQGCSRTIVSRPCSESHLSIHTWPEKGYAAVDLFTCGEPSPLPCSHGEAMRYGGPAVGWRCADGRVAETGGEGSLWRALQALLRGLDARGAMLTWLERGMPSAAVAASGHESGSSGAFGWLGGLEANEQAQRPEL